MKERTFSAIVLLAVLILCMSIGSKVFAIAMLIVGILGFNEFFDVKYDKDRSLMAIRIVGIVSLCLILLNKIFYNVDCSTILLLPLLLLSMPIVFYNDSKRYNINDCLYVIGVVYFLGLSIGNIICFRDADVAKCIYIFIIAFITDTYAYIGGSLIGRHKLTNISPKKTVEGSLVGVVMGVLIGTVYYYNVIGNLTVFQVVMLSLFLTIMSEIGDLFFSSIKRYFNKKDYSNLIPGHGGVLDRFDSVIYVALGLSFVLGLL